MQTPGRQINNKTKLFGKNNGEKKIESIKKKKKRQNLSTWY